MGCHIGVIEEVLGALWTPKFCWWLDNLSLLQTNYSSWRHTVTANSYKIKSAFHFQFKKDLDRCYYQSPEIIEMQNLGKIHNQLLMFPIYQFLNFIWTIPEILAKNLQISIVIPNVVMLHWSVTTYLDWTFHKYCIKLYIFTFHQ